MADFYLMLAEFATTISVHATIGSADSSGHTTALPREPSNCTLPGEQNRRV